jgi:hypothetical protein
MEETNTVIEVVIHKKYATKIIDIVYDLRAAGFVQGEDFEFAYHKAEYDWFSNSDDHYDRYTVFRFKDPSIASWFSLKYNS